MLTRDFITVITRKPAKQGNVYHFSIPQEMINKNIIDPNKYYELRVYVFESK